MRKYITAAQADELKRQALASGTWFTPAPDRVEDLRGWHRLPGVDYYLVPDDDPRVGTTEDIADDHTA